MPRDKRLFMTFPIDFDEHPKVAPLSDAAFRAFVEMNGYSRRHDLDGVIPAGVARKRWVSRALKELTTSHPERPLVIDKGDSYVLRDYAEHQETRESVAARRARNRENGTKGGRPPRNRTETQSVTESVSGSAPERKAESRVQSPEGLTTHVSESQSLQDRARAMTDSMSSVVKGMASRAGITDLASLIVSIHEHTGCVVEAAHAVALTNELVGRAKGEVKHPQRYVVSCLAQSPGEIEKHIYESGWAA